MNSNEIKKAIDFCNEEIGSLELAPVINGCEMKKEWQEQIDIYKTIISAFNLINRYEVEIKGLKIANENMYIASQRQETEIERLEKETKNFGLIGKLYSEIKAEAIKDFAESMHEQIDNLLKEMGVE